MSRVKQTTTGDKTSVSQTVMDFVSSGVASFTDSSGRDHIIYWPSNFNKDPLIPGLHYIKEDDQFVLSSQRLEGLGNARDIELVRNEFGFVDSFFVADHGLEYSDQQWPYGHIYQISVLDNGLLEQKQLSSFKAFNHSVTTSDLNRDGVLDLITQNMGQYNAPDHSLYEALSGFISQNGDYRLMDLKFDQAGGVAWGGGAVLFADLDRNGQDELVQFNYGASDVAEWEWGAFRTYTVDATGTLTYLDSEPRVGAMETMGASTLLSLDIDSDGDLDIAAILEGQHPETPTQQWSGAAIQLFQNHDGEISFAGEYVLKSDLFPMRDMESLDLDFDGVADFVRQTVGSNQWSDMFLLNPGNFSVEPQTPSLDSPAPQGEHMFTRVAQFNNTGPSLVSFYRQGDNIYPVVFEVVSDEKVITDIDSFGGRVFGSGHSDVFNALTNEFEVFGGAGTDYLQFDLLVEDVSVSRSADPDFPVFRIRSDALDALINQVERLNFTNKNLALDITGYNSAGAGYRLYKAAFDRTPDEEGLGYWINELDQGFALHEVANSFVISQEFKNLYGADLNNEGFITALYNNVLDRDPDQGGLDYWINDMENNGMSRADVLASFSESAENIANTDPLIELGVVYQPYDLLG